MLVLNLPFKALMFLTLMRPSLVLFLVLWLKLVKDFLKVRCSLALRPFLISCLIWLDLVASLAVMKERILVVILLRQFKRSSSPARWQATYEIEYDVESRKRLPIGMKSWRRSCARRRANRSRQRAQ